MHFDKHVDQVGWTRHVARLVSCSWKQRSLVRHGAGEGTIRVRSEDRAAAAVTAQGSFFGRRHAINRGLYSSGGKGKGTKKGREEDATRRDATAELQSGGRRRQLPAILSESQLVSGFCWTWDR